MRNQKEFVLSDFGEDNFDRAFNFFGPGTLLPKFDLFRSFLVGDSNVKFQLFKELPMQPTSLRKPNSQRRWIS